MGPLGPPVLDYGAPGTPGNPGELVAWKHATTGSLEARDPLVGCSPWVGSKQATIGWVEKATSFKVGTSSRVARHQAENRLGNFKDFLFWGNFLGLFLELFSLIFEAPGPPQGPQNGPRDPGDRFKIPPQFFCFKNLGRKCQLFLRF